MTQQRNEDRAVPKGRRKVEAGREGKPQGRPSPRIGKTVPVNEQWIQPGLPFETAEDPADAGASGGPDSNPREPEPYEAPKSEDKDEYVSLVTMESVTRMLGKSKRSIAIQLIRLGVSRKTAWRSVYDGRKSLWALSHSPAVDRGLCNAYFAKRGLVSIWEKWQSKRPDIVALAQPVLSPG